LIGDDQWKQDSKNAPLVFNSLIAVTINHVILFTFVLFVHW